MIVNLRISLAIMGFAAFIFFVEVLDRRNRRRNAIWTEADQDADITEPKIPQTPEEAHGRWERETGDRRDKFGRLTFYFTVLATVFAGGAFVAAYRQASIAQQALVATERAWIKVVSPSNFGAMTWDKTNGGFSLSVPLAVENKGNSPALDLKVFITVIQETVPRNVANSAAETKKKCFLGLPTGAVLFPGSPTPARGVQTATKDEVEKYVTHLMNPTKPLEKVPDYFGFDVIACANYRIVGDNAVHTTGIHYSARNLAGGLLHVGEDAQLVLLGDLMGNYAD